MTSPLPASPRKKLLLAPLPVGAGIAALVATILAACGGATESTATPAVDAGTRPIDASSAVDAGPDVDHGAPSDVYPAPHPAPPTIGSAGGAVLATPKIVPIFFSTDTQAAQILASTKELPGSAYWNVASEYGVGPVTVGEAITVTDPPPANVAAEDIPTWIVSMLDGTHAAWGTPDPNAIYTVFYPSGTQMDGACTEYGGYHSDILAGSVEIAYAVLPRCPGGVGTAFFAATHEWLEAATDPHPMADRAFFKPDAAHLAWLTFPGSELGDMCDLDTSAEANAPEISRPVQSLWSNASAAAGHDPCVPASSAPYFNAAPVLPDQVGIHFDYDFGFGYHATTQGLKLRVGESRTIEVDLFSDQKTSGPWSVEARDGTFAPGAEPVLDFSFDRDSGQNGEKLNLTVQALRRPVGGNAPFLLVSSLDRTQHAWVGYVEVVP